MDATFADFVAAHTQELGYQLASTLSPIPPKNDPARLYTFARSNEYDLQNDLMYKLQYNPGLKFDQDEADAWHKVFIAFFKFVKPLVSAEEAQNTGAGATSDWSAVFKAWIEVVNALLYGYQNNLFEAWTIPCLYTAGKYLRVFAIKADDAAASAKSNGTATTSLQEEDMFDESSNHENQENAARHINRIFSVCNNDRNPIEDSRKWALYYVACLLFKTYFRLSQLRLCQNVIQTIRGSPDLPPITSFPRSHQVTFNYYLGVLSFLQEDYVQAEQYLERAYTMCQSKAVRNTELILMYLIPTKMITRNRLPSSALLSDYPALAKLFTPVSQAVKSANLTTFDAALAAGEAQFVKRRIYLTLERVRDVAIRNLFRKVYLAGGYDAPKEGEAAAPRRTRIPITEFSAALVMAGAEVHDGEAAVDQDEVECIISNMIYKNLMKGYIARERGMVVLSKAGAFPETGV